MVVGAVLLKKTARMKEPSSEKGNWTLKTKVARGMRSGRKLPKNLEMGVHETHRKGNKISLRSTEGVNLLAET